MSDPMTNSDIEDVLSSIRRLVSQEPDADASAAARDKLVLTPALRVAGPAPRSDSEPDRAEGADAPHSEPVAPGAADQEAAPKPVPAVDASAERASLERTIAELEAAVSIYQEEWEPDGSETPPAKPATEHAADRGADTPGEPPALADHDESVPEAHEPPAASAGVIDGAANVRPFKQPANGQPGAEYGAAPTSVTPSWPVSGPQERRAASAGHHGSAAPANLSQGVNEPARPSFEDTEGAVYSDADAEFFDEESLRDLVAQIVREELQGRLGERITRNVRKLVRTEISRALASRDFD